MEMKKKKPPVRQCLGCNEHRAKNELLRVVRSPEGDVSLDFKGKKSGRGAYICHDIKCLRRVRKSRRIDRVLECEIPEAVWDNMEEEMEANADNA